MDDNAMFFVSVGGVLLSFMIIVVFAAVRKKQLRERRQEKGVIWLHKLRLLLSAIQKHRGLTTGYLKGGNDILKDIGPLQVSIHREVSAIVNVGGWMEEHLRWQNINQHWARLSSNYSTNNADNNLLQHNNLIQNILYLIDDMAQEHDLLLLKSVGDKPLHLLWRELLTAGEYIGQVRAIGTGVAAAQHCDSVSKIRLTYLCKKIEENTQRVWSKIRPDEHHLHKVSELLSCVNDQVMREQPTISSSEYFKIASDALDSIHSQYDYHIEQAVIVPTREVEAVVHNKRQELVIS